MPSILNQFTCFTAGPWGTSRRNYLYSYIQDLCDSFVIVFVHFNLALGNLIVWHSDWKMVSSFITQTSLKCFIYYLVCRSSLLVDYSFVLVCLGTEILISMASLVNLMGKIFNIYLMCTLLGGRTNLYQKWILIVTWVFTSKGVPAKRVPRLPESNWKVPGSTK